MKSEQNSKQKKPEKLGKPLTKQENRQKDCHGKTRETRNK
jgi:hypothetical protein